LILKKCRKATGIREKLFSGSSPTSICHNADRVTNTKDDREGERARHFKKEGRRKTARRVRPNYSPLLLLEQGSERAK